MPGLLARALRLRTREPGGDEGVTPEEKSRILAEIDELMESQGHVAPVFPLVRRKRGLVLPLLVNAAALVALAAGAAGFELFGRVGTSGLQSSSGARLVTETRLIEALRRDTQTAVAERDRRIAAIQTELASLGAQGGSTQGERSAREDALLAELAGLRSTAANQLADLGRSREEESFLLDQLRNLYHDAAALGAQGDYADARAKVAAARRLLATRGSSPFAAAFSEGTEALDQSLGAAQSLAAAQPASIQALETLRTSYESRLAELVARDKVTSERDAARLGATQAAIARSLNLLRSRVGAPALADPALLEFLSTKMTIRELANSAEARVNYPDLYASLDPLFAALGKDGEQAGARRAWIEAAALLRATSAALPVSTGATTLGVGTVPDPSRSSGTVPDFSASSSTVPGSSGSSSTVPGLPGAANPERAFLDALAELLAAIVASLQ